MMSQMTSSAAEIDSRHMKQDALYRKERVNPRGARITSAPWGGCQLVIGVHHGGEGANDRHSETVWQVSVDFGLCETPS